MAPNRKLLGKVRMQTHKRTNINPSKVPTKTSLKAPTIRIENHKSEVLSCEFHPSGKFILSSNRRGQIQICDIYGTFAKMLVIQGHAGPVMETHFSKDGFDVYSCSTDSAVGVWDTFIGCRKSILEGHKNGVNCVQGNKTGYPLLCSGSNDGFVKIWDVREQKSTLTFEKDVNNAVTATSFSVTGNYVFAGRCDGIIEIWDLRKSKVLHSLSGHSDKITGLSLSPCGSYLLSHSTDDCLRTWDVRPCTTSERAVHCFPSSQKGANNLLRCSWSQDGSMISAGTTESEVLVLDAESGEVLHSLSGHRSNINDVVFHPRESIVLSASNDTFLFLHEIKTFS